MSSISFNIALMCMETSFPNILLFISIIFSLYNLSNPNFAPYKTPNMAAFKTLS